MTIVFLKLVTHRNASQSHAFYHRRPQPILVTYLSGRQERFLVNFFRPSKNQSSSLFKSTRWPGNIGHIIGRCIALWAKTMMAILENLSPNYDYDAHYHKDISNIPGGSICICNTYLLFLTPIIIRIQVIFLKGATTIPTYCFRKNLRSLD